MHINYEFKARCHNLETLESKLKQLNPLFIGADHQADTLFQCAEWKTKASGRDY
jgi:adenylate cyclase class IV